MKIVTNYIKILCENNSKRETMGNKAREKVIKKFSLDANKEKYLKVCINYKFTNGYNLSSNR